MSSDTGPGAGSPNSGRGRFTTSVVGSMPRSGLVRDLLGAEEPPCARRCGTPGGR